MKGRKGKKGSKKYGRMTKKCELYRQQKRREKNKLRRLVKYLRYHPNDRQAERRIQELQDFIAKK